MRARSLLVAAALAAVLLAVPATASATRTLRAGRYGLSALGAFHPLRDPSLGRARQSSGRPRPCTRWGTPAAACAGAG